MTESGDTFNVHAHGDHGTAIGKVEITAAEPELHTEVVIDNQHIENPREGYLTRVAVRITAAYAAETLYVRATAPSILSFGIHASSGSAGRHRLEPNDGEPGVLYATVKRPGADATVEILTGQPDNVQVYAALNEDHPRPPEAGDVLFSMGG
jgi:hypothetical protein